MLRLLFLKELKQDISSFRFEVLGMMKGKFRGRVASSTLAYPGNSFKYSPQFPTDESRQNLDVFDLTTTVQVGAANTTVSESADGPANPSVLQANTEKSCNEAFKDVIDAEGPKKQTGHPLQNGDEVYSVNETKDLECDAQKRELGRTGKVIVKVIHSAEIEPSFKEHIKEANGPKHV